MADWLAEPACGLPVAGLEDLGACARGAEVTGGAGLDEEGWAALCVDGSLDFGSGASFEDEAWAAVDGSFHPGSIGLPLAVLLPALFGVGTPKSSMILRFLSASETGLLVLLDGTVVLLVVVDLALPKKSLISVTSFAPEPPVARVLSFGRDIVLGCRGVTRAL